MNRICFGDDARDGLDYILLCSKKGAEVVERCKSGMYKVLAKLIFWCKNDLKCSEE